MHLLAARFAKPSWPVWAAVISLALLTPSLFSGYYGDDFIHEALFSDKLPVSTPDDASLFGLFSFLDSSKQRTQELMNYSLVPWWVNEHFYFAFWRPLSEITHWVDHQLLGSTQWLMHLHSLIWYMLLLKVLFIVFGRVHQNRVVYGLAIALYAFDSSHGFAISWIANRNAILATLFGALSLLCYIKSSDDDWRPGILLGPLCLLLGLLSAEFAIATTCYLFAYAINLHKKGAWHGLVNLIPYAAITIAWWGIYKSLGFGAQGSDIYYIDPAQNPVGYFSAMAERLPLLLGAQWGIIPVEFYNFSGSFSGVLWLISAGILCLFCLLMIPVITSNPRARFWLIGMILSAIPVCAALPQDRILLLVSVGGCGLLAEVANTYLQKSDFLNKTLLKLGRVMVVCFLVVNLVLSPLILPFSAYSPKIWSQASRDAAMGIGEHDLRDKQTLLFKAPFDVSVFLTAILFHQEEDMPKSLWSISNSGSGATTIDYINEYTLEVETEFGFIRGFDEVMRDVSEYPLTVGDVIPLNGMKIVIESLTEDKHPKRIQLQFDQPLNGRDQVYFYWNGAGFEELDFSRIKNSSITI